MRLAIAEDYDHVDYYGRGSFENYEDRNHAAHVGRYASKVADFYVPYIRPQENGYRTDVRNVSFTNQSGKGLRITADKLISFSASHYPMEDLDPGDLKARRHTKDIQPKGYTWIHLDYKQIGVGGDDSWSKNGLANEAYRIRALKCNYGFTLSLVE